MDNFIRVYQQGHNVNWSTMYIYCKMKFKVVREIYTHQL